MSRQPISGPTWKDKQPFTLASMPQDNFEFVQTLTVKCRISLIKSYVSNYTCICKYEFTQTLRFYVLNQRLISSFESISNHHNDNNNDNDDTTLWSIELWSRINKLKPVIFHTAAQYFPLVQRCYCPMYCRSSQRPGSHCFFLSAELCCCLLGCGDWRKSSRDSTDVLNEPSGRSQ